MGGRDGGAGMGVEGGTWRGGRTAPEVREAAEDGALGAQGVSHPFPVLGEEDLRRLHLEGDALDAAADAIAGAALGAELPPLGAAAVQPGGGEGGREGGAR